jgi:hypothetical protein
MALYPTHADLVAAQEACAETEARYLKRFGWSYDSQTPDYSWRWQRKFDDGRIIMTDAADAIRITERILDKDYAGNYDRAGQ